MRKTVKRKNYDLDEVTIKQAQRVLGTKTETETTQFALSLARLWQRQGQRAEAHEFLAEVYGWFIEGFDTADLQEAKALLDALT